MPSIAEALSQASQLFQAGNFQAAETVYRQILRSDPSSAAAHHSLGNVLKKLGRLEEAAESLKQALRFKPDYVQAHNDLGNVLLDQNDPEGACVHYLRALDFDPTFIDAHNNLGVALKKLGRFDAAARSYREALRYNPRLAAVHLNLGTILRSQGNLDQALASVRQAIDLEPNFAQAYVHLGGMLREQGHDEQAVAAYQHALRLQPEFAEAYYNLGNVFNEPKQQGEALAAYSHALQLKPNWADPHASLAAVLSEQGKPDEAIASLQVATRLAPTAWHQIALATRLPVIYQSPAELQLWRDRLIQQIQQLRQQRTVHDLTDTPALTLFYLAYQGRNDREIMHDAAGLYRAPQQIRYHSAPAQQPRRRKIRVGFVSSYFRDHAVGHWARGLVAQMSRDLFDVTVLSIGAHHDSIAAFFREHADHYLQVPRHLPSARQTIEQQELDVLLYTDIGASRITYSLAFSRLAPVQCTTWGHPITSGLETIDYFISSETVEVSEAQQHYSEKLIRLKNMPIYYYRREVPAALKPRQHFGLAPEDHVYACLQSLFKFHPDFDELLGGILRRDPRAVLLLSSGSVPHWEQLLRNRFAATLSDVLHRIRFLPLLNYSDYLNLLALADVQLDTLHFGGGNTSYDAFTVATPIVTFPSQLLRGRITYALYRQIDVLDCVAHDPQEYIRTALKLGMDPEYRQAIHQKILASNHLLFENVRGVRDLEQFLQHAVERPT